MPTWENSQDPVGGKKTQTHKHATTTQRYHRTLLFSEVNSIEHNLKAYRITPIKISAPTQVPSQPNKTAQSKMPTTYTIEEAKSGRATCKKCKEKIDKGALRIGTHAESEDRPTMTSWNHLECFILPRKFKAEYTKEQFLDEMVTDETADKILDDDEKKMELVDKMSSRVAVKKSKKRDRDEAAAEDTDTGALALIKANALLLHPDEGDEKPKKKVKMEAMDKRLAEAYIKYSQMKIAELHDYLQWNKQPKTGKKNILLMRAIDGDARGRLPLCPSCEKGKLKVNDEGTKIVCSGFFNEDSGSYEKCYMETDFDKIDR